MIKNLYRENMLEPPEWGGLTNTQKLSNYHPKNAIHKAKRSTIILHSYVTKLSLLIYRVVILDFFIFK